MNDQKKPSGESTAARLSSVAATAKEKVSNAASDAKDQLADVGRKAQEKFQEAADYVRNVDYQAIGEDVKDFVKRNPGAALAAAAVVGFLIAHAVRRD